jgi:uncharacterized membrane protein
VRRTDRQPKRIRSVAIAVISAAAPCAYVRCFFPIFSPTVNFRGLDSRCCLSEIFPAQVLSASCLTNPPAAGNLSAEIMLTVPLLLALLVGVFAGLRCLTPPAAVCRAACLGWFDLSHSHLHLAIASHQQVWLGALPGLCGSTAGCFGGFQARVRSAKALECPDFVIALLEDLIAIGGAFFVVTRF